MNTLWTLAWNAQGTLLDTLARLYQNPFVSKIISIVWAILIAFALFAVSKIVATYIKNKITRSFVLKGNKEVENVSSLIGDIIFYALIMFSLYISFSIAGIDIGLILWGISIGVGFAFRTTLTNLISGIMIYTTKEYQPGSIVNVKIGKQEYLGKIEEINMKDTILRAFDFKRIVIPNSKFVSSLVKTYSLEEVLKLEIDINIDINLDIEKVIDLTLAKTNSYDFVLYKQYTQVLIDSFDQKVCRMKVAFCFNPNAGIPTDLMQSKVQAGLIEEYKKMAKAKAAV